MVTQRNRTRVPGGYGRNELQRLLPRHHKILQLALAGHSNAVIAKTLGITSRSVSIVLQCPLSQSELKRRRENTDETDMLRLDRDAHLGKVRSFMEQEVGTAAETIVGLMGSDDQNLQLRSAKEILDRVFGKVDGGKDGNNGVVNISISGDQTALLILALKESPNGKNSIRSADVRTPVSAEGGQGVIEGRVHQAPETTSVGPGSGEADALDSIDGKVGS